MTHSVSFHNVTRTPQNVPQLLEKSSSSGNGCGVYWEVSEKSGGNRTLFTAPVCRPTLRLFYVEHFTTSLKLASASRSSYMSAVTIVRVSGNTGISTIGSQRG